MPKPKPLTWMAYVSPYGGESLRCGPGEALARVEALFARMAPGALPERLEVFVDDEQTEALYRATRTGGGPSPDPESAFAAHGGVVNPLATELAKALGPGTRARFASGACGDLWRTSWTVDRDEAGPRWPGVRDIVLAHLDAPPVHASWGARERGERPESPLSLVVHWSVRLRRLDGTDPFPVYTSPYDQWLTASRVILFLRPDPAAIFHLFAPHPGVDGAFAEWVRALDGLLGFELHDRRWEIAHVDPTDPKNLHTTQGRFSRRAAARTEVPELGPWTPLVEEMLADRVAKHREWDLRDELLRQPVGPTALALVRGMLVLKGAALERGSVALRAIAEAHPEDEGIGAALELLFREAPSPAVARKVGYALAPCLGAPWFADAVMAQLVEKKPSSAVLPAVEEAAIHSDERVSRAAKAQLLVRVLRTIRAKGAAGYRGTFANVLARIEDGGAWPTMLLEAATAPAKDESRPPYTWTWNRLETWCAYGARGAVSDPAFGPYEARVPPAGPLPAAGQTLTLTDEERAALSRREAAFVGSAG